MYKLRSKITNASYISPYGEKKNTHFLNLPDSTHPPLNLPYLPDGNEAQTLKLSKNVSAL
jgi:hypothetical protein